MVREEFLSHLKDHQLVQAKQLESLRSLTLEYPYFQSAKALYLKSLKAAGKIEYNGQLKKTAAQTVDRTVLFDFITKIVENHPEAEQQTEVIVEEKQREQEHTLEQVIQFTSSDNYSFSQWLKLGSLKQVDQRIVKDENDKIIAFDQKTKDEDLHQNLIDKFLSTNPKMPKVEKTQAKTPIINTEEQTEEGLMTETLAQVYVAQKKYQNALIAYRILSLKNPEKSGYFADLIAKIEELQKK
ncbi:MAG: hypothetical protein ACPGRE_00640 [Flavobacteriaceae bacterium]